MKTGVVIDTQREDSEVINHIMRLATIVAECLFFFFSSRRRHTRCSRDWSSDVCSSDLTMTISNPLEATGLRSRDPATDRHRAGAAVRILNSQDCEPRRAPWYVRIRCKDRKSVV